MPSFAGTRRLDEVPSKVQGLGFRFRVSGLGGFGVLGFWGFGVLGFRV